MHRSPWDILGLQPSSDPETVNTVKEAWRRQAKLCHPDLNKSQEAARQFAEITKARDAILQRLSQPPEYAAAQNLRQAWANSNAQNSYEAANSMPFIMKHKNRAALIFAATSFIAGCGLFIGALMTYKAFDKYSYSSPERVEERLKAYNPQRERLLDRIVMERAEIASRGKLSRER